MLLLKYLMLIVGAGVSLGAAAIVAYDIYTIVSYQRLLRRGAADNLPVPNPVRWSSVKKLMMVAWLPLLIGLSIVVVPSGMAGVRVSQISGTRPGTLYPGLHFIKPLLEHVALFDVRDHVFTTDAASEPAKKAEVLRVTSQEGLAIGLGVNVRYRLDPKRLDYIQNNLPQPVEEEIVPPVVGSVFRELVPGYTVRDVFAARREEICKRAADEIARRLGGDGILVKEVIVRDIKLPEEYAKGLEGLLLKEQENDRLVFETEIHEKQVRIAELQAEAEKVQQVKHAEGDAHDRRQSKRRKRQLHRTGEDLQDAVEDRALAAQPAAEIPAHGVADVVPVLDPDRPVQAELMADLRGPLLGEGLVAGKNEHGVTGDEVQHEKCEYRDADQDGDKLNYPLRDVAQHLSLGVRRPGGGAGDSAQG